LTGFPEPNVNPANWTPAHYTSQANCGGSTTASRWHWQPITLDQDFPTLAASGITNGINQWKSTNQIDISLNTSVRWDLVATEGSIGGASVGVTTTYGSGCFGCVGYVEQVTGQCVTSDWVAAADVTLDPWGINYVANAVGTTAAVITSGVYAHEFGHVLKLDEVLPGNGRCSEVQSIMYQDIFLSYLCGVMAPTSADKAVINSFYPGSVPFASAAGPTPYCTSTTC
jgi:hypothetical protein